MPTFLQLTKQNLKKFIKFNLKQVKRMLYLLDY